MFRARDQIQKIFIIRDFTGLWIALKKKIHRILSDWTKLENVTSPEVFVLFFFYVIKVTVINLLFILTLDYLQC